jgi:hypothetical protein
MDGVRRLCVQTEGGDSQLNAVIDDVLAVNAAPQVTAQ